jgi:hypothetical protein
MTRLALGLFVALAASAARADEPAYTITDVKKAWKARQEANKSFRIEWVETVTVKAGSYGDPFGMDGPGPHPPKDHEFKATCSFAIEGEKWAVADERMAYAPGTKDWLPHAASTSFDGETWMTVFPLLSRGWARVQIETGTSRNSGFFSSLINHPVRMTYRPLSGPAPFNFEQYKLTGRTAKIGEVECVEIVPTDKAKKDGPPGYDYSLWCDPDRDFLPIREKYRRASGGHDVDYAYRQDEKGRWMLSGWATRRLGPKEAVQSTYKAEVKKLELAPKFAADAFAPNPPPGSHVMPYKNGMKQEEHLVRQDGSKRAIKAAEENKSYDELAKTNADGTPYVPKKK